MCTIRRWSFDAVVSSLSLHYVRDYAGLVRRIARWLRPEGLLVLSTEHPIFTARATAEGWIVDSEGTRTAGAIDDYADEGIREHAWFMSGVQRYHRPLSAFLNGLIEAGFRVDRLVEPTPSAAWLRERPRDVDESRRPLFPLIRARMA